jgi:MarR family transcriptional regulator, organic hydroperoxide resistance regulator
MSLEDEARYIRTVISKLNKLIEQALDEDAKKKGANLTRAQVSVLHQLSETPGISIKDLSACMGLAQSTLSGIVDRLEKKQLVERRTDEEDKRVTRVYLSPVVESYMERDMYGIMEAPLVASLAKATEEELTQIRIGLSTLERLLAGGD